MSKYTTEVRYICEVTAGLTDSAGFNSIDNILSRETVEKIFNFDYPIFDEEYRYPLNKKILRHFYTREIGEETVGLWKLRLSQMMNEIMPYYNKLYTSELDNINPYWNIDITTTGNREKDRNKTANHSTNTTENRTGNKNISSNSLESGSSTENKLGTNTKDKNINTTEVTNDISNVTKKGNDIKTTTTTGTHKETTEDNGEVTHAGKVTTANTNVNTNRYSDTPQGGLDGMKAIQQNMYLTNATITDDSGNGVTNTTDITKSKDKTYDVAIDSGTGKDNLTRNETNAGTSNSTTKKTGGDKTTDNINENTRKSTSVNGSETTNATNNDNMNRNSQRNVNENIDTSEEYVERVSGYKGNKAYAELIMEWRKSFLNIDKMILKDLEDCFFQLW